MFLLELSEFPECPKHIILESPEGFLTFVLEPQNSCFFESPMGFLTFVFGAQDSCSPTFAFGAQNSCTGCLRARRVSWHLFLAPKTHVFFWDPSEFPDICCWCAKLMFLESPEDLLTFVLVLKSHAFESPMVFLTFVFGAEDLCVFFDSPDICFWCTKLLCRLFESPASFLTFVFGARNTCFWDPSEFPDICCWRAKLMFLESPEGFLTFVLVPKIHVLFQRARRVSWHLFFGSKTHAFWEPGEFPDLCFWCPKLMFFYSPEGFLTFVLVPKCDALLRAQWVSWHLFGAQDSCAFFTAPTFAFGAQNSCTGCLRARRVSWHLFWRPKHMFLITASFLTFVVGVQKSCFFESPEGFLTFVLVPKIHVLFQRARRVSWHLFFGSKTHAFWEPGEFPDLCFWWPKLMFFESPEGFLTFVLVPKFHALLRAQWVSWRLFLVPKTHCFLVPKLMFFWEPGEFPDLCFWCPKLMFFYSPEGFLTFVLVPKFDALLRAQWVSWHLFLVAKTHVFFLQPRHLLLVHKTLVHVVWEPGEFPDICFGAQNTCFWSQRVSWHLLLVSKTHVFLTFVLEPQNSCFFESPMGFLTFVFGAQDPCFFDSPDICFWCTKLLYRLFESPASFLTFVFGAQDPCFFWQPRHLLLVHKTLVQVVWEPGEFPDICFWRPKHMFFFEIGALQTRLFTTGPGRSGKDKKGPKPFKLPIGRVSRWTGFPGSDRV